MELKHVNYDSWVKANPDLAETSTLEKCPECRGRGIETCYHCGSDVECEHCGGTGIIGEGPNLKLLYERECLREEIAYARFFGRAVDQEVLDKYHRICKDVARQERLCA